jgi:hypothetical protein
MRCTRLMGLVGIGAIMAPLNRLASLWLARKPGLADRLVSAGGAAGAGAGAVLRAPSHRDRGLAPGRICCWGAVHRG